MACVRIVSSSTVQATTNREPHQRIELNPCDLRFLVLGSIQKGLLFLKPKPSSEEKKLEETLIQRLKTSLSGTLDFFTPLAGRLAITEHDDNTISYFIDCNNVGAQFVHAIADGLTIADILEPIYVPPVVHSFFPLNGVKNNEGVSKPLLAVQVTEIVDGIFVGCAINHAVADGTSFWNFFNSWSEISRGLDCISKPPVLKRCFPNGSCSPIRFPLSSIKNISDDEFIPPPLQERIFHFCREKISALKDKANAEAGREKISSLQALLAHVWLSITRSRQLDPDQETAFLLPTGIRSRLHPPLPEQYFGNAVLCGIVTLEAKELLDHGLGYTALQMNKVVALHTEDKVKNILESWIENPQILTMAGNFIGNVLLASSSPRFNVYGNDFGWGTPVAVRSGPGNKFDGKITLFPGVGEGSVDVEVCILPRTMQAMEKDLEFMAAVTI